MTKELQLRTAMLAASKLQLELSQIVDPRTGDLERSVDELRSILTEMLTYELDKKRGRL